jgi:hypothetical protein
MLLDSNILIYGAKDEYPALDAILDCTDLSPAFLSQRHFHPEGMDEFSPIFQDWDRVESLYKSRRDG